jgi:DNA primase
MLFGEKARPKMFPDWWLESFAPAYDMPWARAYLDSRDVPASVVKALDLRADSEERRICFPVRDFANRLMGLHGRAVDTGAPLRYRMYTYAKKNNPMIWLGESWIDPSKPIVVVEGPFDLASVYRVYHNVTSPLYATPSADKIRRMADCMEWITFFDRGKGGDAGREKIAKVLHKQHVLTHLQPPGSKKDPGVCTLEELTALLKPLVKLDGIQS